MAKKRLGERLRELGKIDDQTLQEALASQRSGTQPLGELLLRQKLVSKDDLVQALRDVGLHEYVDPRELLPDPDLVRRVPRAVAQRYNAIPIHRDGRRIVVVLAEPQNLQALHELSFLCGAEIIPRLGFRREIDQAISTAYGDSHDLSTGVSDPELASFLDRSDIGDVEFTTTSSSERAKAAMEEMRAELRHERTPAVRLVSAILATAAEKGASDVHVEPQPMGALIRIRVDGVMRELGQIPPELQTSLISRIKILADLDISERRQPQDGRFLVRIGSTSLDLRVSTLPTHHGEKAVLRLLNPDATTVGFDRLGFSPEVERTLTSLLRLPQGMILVTGPTGSGKSTTLYSFLKIVCSPEVNVITVEDPVEYKMAHVNQVQINPKAGLTFATTLRSILRQDPNVIMVGEVRDAETAEIALQASQTGHMVFSSLHTNDAVAAVTRLLDLGVPGFMVASSLTAIVAQRLVRKLCSCALKAPVTAEYLSRLGDIGVIGIHDPPKFMYLPGRCERCDKTGYRGRIGVYEALVFDEAVRTAVRTGARDQEIRSLARANDMRMMQEDALEKVARGLTSLDEVLRAVPFENLVTARCKNCSRPLAPSFEFCPYCGGSTRSRPSSMRPAWVRSGGS